MRETAVKGDHSVTALRKFHDAFLQYGGLPISLIRWGLGVNAA